MKHEGLAEGVANSRLVSLEIRSGPWVNDEDPRHHLAGGKTYDSPLTFFFYSPTHRYGPSLLPRGFAVNPRDSHSARPVFMFSGNPMKQLYIRAACRDLPVPA